MVNPNKGLRPPSPAMPKMTPEEKREVAARARAEEIGEDVMRAVTTMLVDALAIDELREHVVRRLLAMPEGERIREIQRIIQAAGLSIPTA
jgi:hypothetical protein